MIAQPKNGFQFYLEKLNQIGKDSHKNFRKLLTLKETSNTKESYAMKFVESQMKQLNSAVRIERLVRKAYSLNTHDYKNTKIKKFNNDSNTTVTERSDRKESITSIFNSREPYIDFKKLVDKLEQAEITMKLEETEKLNLQYVNNIHANTSQINKVHDSDTEIAEQIHQRLNIYEKNPNFEGKLSFKNWCNYCRRY